MRNPIAVFTLAVTLLVARGSTQDATTRPVPPTPGSLLDGISRILDDLKLTTDQRKQIDGILEDGRKQFRDMRDDLDKLEGPQRLEKLRQFLADQHEKIADLLDDDQRLVFEKRLADLREKLRGGAEQYSQVVLDRIKEALPKLSLSDEQKKNIDTVIDETSKKLDDLKSQGQQVGQSAMRAVRDIMQDARQRMGEILTDDQKQQLRDLMQRRPEPRDDRPSESKPASPASKSVDPAAPSTIKPADGGAMMNDDNNMQGTPAVTPQGPPAPPPKQAVVVAAVQPAAPAIEAKAASPAESTTLAPDFTLKKLDGPSISLAAFKGKILVIEAGSWSCPVFRQHAAAMEQLKIKMGTRATFLILYTQEAHPRDTWEVDRNREEKIAVDQPKTDDDRRELAKKARDALKLTIPIAIDTMDNAVATAYGLFPNGSAIIGRDGKILAHQQWTDPSGLSRLIEEAAASPAAN